MDDPEIATDVSQGLAFPTMQQKLQTCLQLILGASHLFLELSTCDCIAIPSLSRAGEFLYCKQPRCSL